MAFIYSDDTFAQCAMCRKNAEGSNIAKGLNTGILYLMAIPYFMIAFIFREQIKSLFKSLRAKVSSK